MQGVKIYAYLIKCSHVWFGHGHIVQQLEGKRNVKLYFWTRCSCEYSSSLGPEGAILIIKFSAIVLFVAAAS